MEERSETAWQNWRKVIPYLLWVVAGIVGILVLIFVPKIQVSACHPEKEGLSAKICFDIENEARRTVAYIEGGLLAIVGIMLTIRRIRALEDQVKVAQEGQITERFTRAIEQLGSDKMEIRLGGIYALERIANDSDKDYWPIMETLTAYVRERVPWREPPLEAAALAGATTPEATTNNPKPATDIQAVLTVLGRRKYRYKQGENQPLDFTGTDLRGINLVGSHLEGANLMNAHLEGSDLRRAHLEGASLIRSHLGEARLCDAHLERAHLREAHLEGANLKRAHLESANLWGATGLTTEQLDKAILDDKTILPELFAREAPGGQGTGGE